MSLLVLVTNVFAVLFAGGLGIVSILVGAGAISLGAVERFLDSAAGIGLLFGVGGVLLALALYFIRLIHQRQMAAARFSQEGEWGKIELSPYALREFISGILRREIGIDRFRVRLQHMEDGIAIKVRTTLSPEEQVAEVGRRIQETLSQRVVERTGVEVREVSVLVDSISAREEEPQDQEEETPVDESK
jgi:uncharacterized alkaline shock family protein YloU/energy-converting hydrogenase Eha subunit C